MVLLFLEGVSAMKVRIKFTKTGALRFVGHLDLMRTFQKIFRRSGIPISYSEGFNPHQRLSIAAPLSVGITSEAEYLDLVLDENREIDELLSQINEICPPGLRMLEGVVLREDCMAAMAFVSAADYRVSFTDSQIDAAMLKGFMNQEQILVKKMSKKGKLQDIDLKPGIYKLALEEAQLLMTLSSGSRFNIKPELVIEAVFDYAGIAYHPYHYRIHRTEIYGGDKELRPLLEE